MVGRGGQRPKDLPPRGRYRKERLREDDKVLSPRSSPHVQKGLVSGWARTEWVSSSGEPGSRSECGRRSSGEGRAQPGGRKRRQGLDESVGGERGGHPLFPPILLGEGECWKEAKVGGERGGHPLFPPTMFGEGGVGRRQRGGKWWFGGGGVRNGGGTFGRCEREERVREVGEGLTDAV